MANTLFTPAEQSALLLSAYGLQSDKDAERFLSKVERVLLAKMYAKSETERALGLTPNKS